MPAASFSHASGTITFTLAPLQPSGSLAFVQSREQTAGGVRSAADWYVKNDLIPLPLRLTDAEVPTFLDFYRNIARGAAQPFTYTDVHGTAGTVTFEGALPEIVERAYNLHTVTVLLRLQ